MRVDDASEETACKYLDWFFQSRLRALGSFEIRRSLSKCDLFSFMINRRGSAPAIVKILVEAHITEADEAFFRQVLFQSVTPGTFQLKTATLLESELSQTELEYTERRDAAVNRFTAEFVKDFCFVDGRIDWDKLVRFVSEDTAKR